jgi:hypothetical protein
MNKEELFAVVKELVIKHNPLLIGKASLLGDVYDHDVEGIAIYLADKSNVINLETIAKRVLFVFKNSFSKEAAKDAPYVLARLSKDIFEAVKK